MGNWINQWQNKEDIQQESFTQIAQIINMIDIAIYNHDVKTMIPALKSLLPRVQTKLPDSTKYKDKVCQIENEYYQLDPEENTYLPTVSQMFDDLYEVWWNVSGVLSEEGLLLKAYTHPSEIAVRGISR